MLSTSELKSYAHMRRLKHVETFWKDYLQDVVLYLISRRVPRLVFRGRTWIWKLMRGDSFSEDLDLCTDAFPNFRETSHATSMTSTFCSGKAHL
jgi:predicted nucleotidyltransferase component of viral defense system